MQSENCRQSIHIVRLFIYVGIMLCYLLPSSALPVGGLVRVKPTVHVRLDANEKSPWTVAGNRYKLTYGNCIRTDTHGNATVLLNNGTEILMKGGTSIQIVAPAAANKPLVVRVFGALSEIFVKAKGNTEIRSAACNAAVRGTEFLVQLPADDRTVLTVTEGAVEFYNQNGQVLVAAGQQSSARSGQAPTPPVATDATGLLRWTADLTDLPLDVETPANLDAPLRAALSAMTAGQFGQTRAALDAMPQTAWSHTIRGLLELQDSHPDRALDALRTATTLDQRLYQAHALLALAQLTQHQLADATTSARTAVALAPDSAQAQGTLAMVLFFTDQPKEAARASTQAVQADPFSPMALLTEGRIALAASRLDEARNALQQAQALAPNLPIVYTELGQVYLRLGLLAKAETAFRQALTLKMVSPEAHTGLGVCLQQRGQVAEALAAHQQALALDPGNAMARVNLAALHTEQGDLTVAEALLRTGVAEQSEHGLLYARLAVINLYAQRIFAAQVYAQRAVALVPKSAIAHFVLGQVYQEQGRTSFAGQEYRLAATLDPDYAPARYALGVIREHVETGMDLTHPRGTILAAESASPGQVLDIQNMQAPGFEDRIQAAVQDPTAVRVASRAFGDLEVSGSLGENATRAGTFSYLHENADRRGVIGLVGSEQTWKGFRANADTNTRMYGVSLGQKAQNSPSGVFALAQYRHRDAGTDVGQFSDPIKVGLRDIFDMPYLLVGGNGQTGDTHRTLALAAIERPHDQAQDSTNGGDIQRHMKGFHAEIRHDLRWHSHRVSVGGGVGRREFSVDAFLPPPAGLPIPPFQYSSFERLDWSQVYLHDRMRLTDSLTMIGEVRVNHTRSWKQLTMLMPPLPADPPTTVSHTDVLPAMTLDWQLGQTDAVRIRARGVSGGVEDFQLLVPVDVFLLPTSEIPMLNIGGRGRSYEAEYSHLFADTSLLRIGGLRQELRNSTLYSSVENYQKSVYQALHLRYERVLSPYWTGFAETSFIQSSGVVVFTDGMTTQNDEITAIPRVAGEIGVQYLDKQGWFVQPAYGIIGSRYRDYMYFGVPPVSPRTRAASVSVMNLRLGKRWELDTAVYIEVANLLNRPFSYLPPRSASERWQPGRQIALGISRRY